MDGWMGEPVCRHRPGGAVQKNLLDDRSRERINIFMTNDWSLDLLEGVGLGEEAVVDVVGDGEGCGGHLGLLEVKDIPVLETRLRC